MRPLDDRNDMPRELFIVRTPEGQRVPGMQPVFELFPHLEEWPTKDLYERHPTRPDHWRCIGRNDDVLVLSNGEKLNPVDTESRVVNSHSKISGALVIGQGQFAPGLLVEVRDLDVSQASQRASLIEEIWPSIQAANKEAAGHAQLSKGLILFTSPSKPFLRTPKLSVRRKPTIDLYTREIEQMYETYGRDTGQEDSQVQGAIMLDLHSEDGIQRFVRESIASVTGWEDLPTDDEDLFMLGMDSLQAVRIARAIKFGISRSGSSFDFAPRQVYQNPTILALSREIGLLLQSTSVAPGNAQRKREEVIAKQIKQYSNFDDERPFSSEPSTVHEDEISNHTRKDNIILTGTTGSLGSYMLLSLLKNSGSSVRHIYCLNRSKTARDQFMAFLKDLGDDTFAVDSQVSFFQTPSLGLPKLGLDESHYELLLQANITHILHNAWPVNFNLSLSSFASHLSGVRRLVEFCYQCSTFSSFLKLIQMPALTFVSSLSSVTNLSGSSRVPESIVFDSSAPASSGYGESKYVAEHVLYEASKQIPGLSTTILRIGQIAGPIEHNSIWPTREWLPSLIVSSKSIDALPSDLGRMTDVDWIPVDVLADCISEIILGGTKNEGEQQSSREDSNNGRCKVYHVVNPNIVSWGSLLPVVQDRTRIFRTKPLHEWIELVQGGPDVDQAPTVSAKAGAINPAKKILQFYQGLQQPRNADHGYAYPPNAMENKSIDKSHALDDDALLAVRLYQLENMAGVSTTFRSLKPVNGAWLAKWIDGWL